MEPKTLEQSLVGQTLGQVTFVMDYFQAGTEMGLMLTYYQWPWITCGGTRTSFESPNFADSARQLIGRRILECRLDDEQLLLRLEGDTDLAVSLRLDELTGPEAVMIRDQEAWWVLP